jgi:hypothetical protein
MHRSMPRATLLALAITGVASTALAQVPLPPARRPAPAVQPAVTAPVQAPDAPGAAPAADAPTDAAPRAAGNAPAGPALPPDDAPPAPAHDDGETLWPQTATADGVSYTLYAPQFESIDPTRARARAAFSAAKGSDAPAFGALFFTADLDHDGPAGLLELSNLEVDRASFADGRNADAAATELQTMLFGVRFTANRADVMRTMQVAKDRAAAGSALSTDVPPITVVNRRATLLLLDGRPVLRPVGDGSIGIAQNTPSLLAYDKGSRTWFTRVGSGTWMHASAFTGPYVAGRAPTPEQVAAIEAALPKRTPDPAPTLEPGAAPAPAAPADPPDIVVSTTPRCLVSIDGPAKLAAVADGLYAVTNANCDLFTTSSDGAWWLLASGRWFTTADLVNGPWSPAPAASLPAAFASIDPHGTWGNVRASVPGTPEAMNALAQQDVPHVATLDRAKAHARVTVIGGAPRLRPIAGTSMQYATNTSAPMIACSGRYYVCDNAAWFASDAPGGPWSLCDSVPEEIYSIPPSCPVYNVTFVEVYDSTPDTVTFGYTAGYMNSFVSGGSVVWGTGYATPGSTEHGDVSIGDNGDITFDGDWGPYSGWPSTYGYWPCYGPYLGGWGFGGYPGWGGYGLWCGPWWSGAGWWGPGWGFGAGYALGFGFANAWDWGYHPWGWRDREGWWNSHWHGAYTRGWGNAARDLNRAAGAAGADRPARAAGAAREAGAAWSHAAGAANNVFANRDGQVMQRRGDELYRRSGDAWHQASRDAGSDARAAERPGARTADGSWRDHGTQRGGTGFEERDTSAWSHAQARDAGTDAGFRPDPNHNFDGSPRGAFARGEANYADRGGAGGGWQGSNGAGAAGNAVRAGAWNGGSWERASGWGIGDQVGTYAQRWGNDYDRGLPGFNQDTGWYDRTVSRPANPYGYGYNGWSNGYRGYGALSGWGGARMGGMRMGGMRMGGGGRR